LAVTRKSGRRQFEDRDKTIVFRHRTPDVVRRKPFCHRTPAVRAPWKMTRGSEEVEVVPRISVTVNNGQAVRMAARAGLGVVMQPAILLSADIQAGLLVRLFADWQLRERPMSLIYHRDRRMTPRLRSIIAFALSEFGGAGGGPQNADPG
jgi:DNA-binding transcriptional LysR family regulator